jgi:nucleotide-binding universal stress UspA family protein
MSTRLHRPNDQDWLESPRRILFPTDFGGAAQRTWSYALAVAQALGAEVLLLHVVESVVTDFRDRAGIMGVVTAEGSLLRAVEGLLERMRAEAAEAGVHAQTIVVVGRVRREIVRAAREARATFIVMGTSGREGLRRTILGSVAEWVVGHAPCPVWTVRYGSRPPTAFVRGETEPACDRPVFRRSAGA